MKLLEGFANLLYPAACMICGRSDRQGTPHLCWECRATLQWIHDPICRCCGNPAAGEVCHDYDCSLCASKPRSFDRARSAVRYENAAAEMLRALKYRGASWAARDLAALAAACARVHFPDESPGVVTWVPAHPGRVFRRGYSQARLLARETARILGLPAHRLLTCSRRVPSQTNLTANQRALNVKDAFAARASAKGKVILLVDDVMTTGATADACARALKQQGAAKVLAVTVARR